MHVLTVTDVNAYLRELLDADEILRDIWVQGEVFDFKPVASGHWYFKLKDGDAVLAAVCWRSHVARLATRPCNGDAVLAHGRVGFYEAGGALQLYVDMIQPAGIGLLHAEFERLRARLEAEGLFDPSRKRALPPLPYRIGVATSPSGAVIRDIVNVLGRRCPLVEVVLAPCQVQGERAPDSIVEALYALYGAGVDVIILARGGGSMEELWAFNDEAVARAVYASPVPLVTGVGHETDTTIVDYVADLRAPTPSAAAELVVPERAELLAMLELLRGRLAATVLQGLAARRRDLAAVDDRLRRQSPAARLARDRQRIDELLRQAGACVAHAIELRQARLDGLRAQLGALSPRATLDRGYAIVRRAADGAVVTAASQARPGAQVDITLHSGALSAQIIEPQTTENTPQMNTDEHR